MRFFVSNDTGITLHVQLVRDAADQLELIVAIRKPGKPKNGRAIVEFVLPTKKSIPIPTLNKVESFKFGTDVGFQAHQETDDDGDMFLKITNVLS